VDTNDVLIASYPRSGSTWMRFLLFDVFSGNKSDFIKVNRGIPGVENQSTAIPLLHGSGRLLQTHELYRPEYNKAIYLIRDVRDVVISEYYFSLRNGVITNDFDSFLFQFLHGRVNPFGSWEEHIESWLDSTIALNGNVLFIRFEEMRQNIVAVLTKTLDFLGIENDLEVIRKAVENNTIEKMREKESMAPKGTFKTNRTDIQFIRKGAAGGWKGKLSEDQLKMIENRLGGILERVGYPIEDFLHKSLKE
jgi:hypothetical protein